MKRTGGKPSNDVSGRGKPAIDNFVAIYEAKYAKEICTGPARIAG